MPRKKKSEQAKIVDRLHTAAWLLDCEADNLDDKHGPIPASDTGQLTAGGFATVSDILRGVADGLRKLAQYV
jgi:hypothetical protein